MDQHTKPDVALFRPSNKTNTYYPLLNIILIIVLPALSVIAEYKIEHSKIDWNLIGKWFVFWGVGLCLFLTGIRQASSPEFTVTKIFKLRNRDTFILNRKLGFANIALGTMGILSVINNEWRIIAAITSGILFGLAVIQHISKAPENSNEIISLVYDILTFFMLALYLVFTLIF